MKALKQITKFGMRNVGDRTLLRPSSSSTAGFCIPKCRTQYLQFWGWHALALRRWTPSSL